MRRMPVRLLHRKACHVRPLDGRWEVREEGHAVPLGVYDEREEAIEIARDAVAIGACAQMIVHHPDGTVATRWPTDGHREGR